MISGDRSGNCSSAVKDTVSAIWALMALLLAPERATIAGTSYGLRASLSATAIEYSSFR